MTDTPNQLSEEAEQYLRDAATVNARWVPYAETYRIELGERAVWYLGTGYLGYGKCKYMMMPWWVDQ